MRQFQVPQFITVEDTIVGPLTIKQFAYIGIGVLVIGVLYKLLPGTIFFLIAPIVGGITGSLAFLKVNDQPLPKILRHGISYLAPPRLFIWRRMEPKKTTATIDLPKTPEALINTIPKLSESKLSDLSWSLDIKEKQKP